MRVVGGFQVCDVALLYLFFVHDFGARNILMILHCFCYSGFVQINVGALRGSQVCEFAILQCCFKDFAFSEGLKRSIVLILCSCCKCFVKLEFRAFGTLSRVLKQLKVEDFQVFDVALFYYSCLMISNHVIDFMLVWERSPIVSLNYSTVVLQACRENLSNNTLTVGLDFYRDWHAPVHRK